MVVLKRHKLNPEKWVDNYSDYLFAFAVTKINDISLVEDLIQDTLFSAFKNQASFKGNSSEKTWLTSILKNKIIDHFRKSSSQNEKVILDNYWEISGDDSPFIKDGKFKGHWTGTASERILQFDVDRFIESDEFYKILNDCIAQLSSNHALIFRLKIIDGIDRKQICKDLNISSSNFWVIIHRAKMQVRECISKRWL